MDPKEFAAGYSKALKFSAEGLAPEVLPVSYAVIQARATQNKPDRVISKHTTLPDAWQKRADLSDANKSGYYHIHAVYPDKSTKALTSTGDETGGYNLALNSGVLEHTPEGQLPYSEPRHHADAAPVSLHRLAQLALFSGAEAGTRGAGLKTSGHPVGPGSEPHTLARSALETGDFTPLLALADYWEERGQRHIPSHIRKLVDKYHQKTERLKSLRLLRG